LYPLTEVSFYCCSDPDLVATVVKKVLIDLGRKPLYLPGNYVGMEHRLGSALKQIEASKADANVKVSS
jgi:hypothetical protein